MLLSTIRQSLHLLVNGLLSVGLLTVACAQDTKPSNEVSQAEKDVGFVSMFSGADFVGWRFDGQEAPPANWKVADGMIQLSGGGAPHLASAKAYGDFEMKFEWRSPKENYNSGFFIRSGPKVGTNQINLAKGGEGAFIGGKITGAKAVSKLQKPAGEWNEWRFLVVGDKVTFWCNGQQAWEGTGLQPAEGHIGLQAEGAALEFRKFRIREIK